MKNYTLNRFFLFLILILLSFKKILNEEEGCKYYDENNKEKTTNETYLNEYKGDTAKQACYSLSFFEGTNKKCCYDFTDSSKPQCILKEENYVPASDSKHNCPEKSKIYNNCGMAGIFQPLTSDICTSISLVQGYCCFVKIKSLGTACVRTKELNEDKNTTTNQITDYVKTVNGGAEIESVICKETYLKYFWSLFFFVFIFLL